MKRPLAPFLIGLAFFVALAAWGSRQYIVPDPWSAYKAEVRDYLGAAARGDSVALARKAASPEPVAWARNAALHDSAVLARWSRELGTLTGERHGDTVAVVLTGGRAGRCSLMSSVSALFLNHTTSPRLLAIGSACVYNGPLRVLRDRSSASRILVPTAPPAH